MMHTYSAHVIKSKIAPTNHKPKDGTATRKAYDLFYTNKGKPVPFCTTPVNYAALNQLIDVYGLDIRRLKKNTWCLVGEWYGKVYIDYLVPSNVGNPT